MNPAVTFPASRVAPNLSHAWGGIWRLTLRRLLLPSYWVMVAIGLGVLILLFIGGLHGGGNAADRFLDWTVNFYVTFLVPAVAFMAAAGAMRDEMKSGTIDYVLTRPLPRPAFVAFKFLAHTITVQLTLLLAFGVVLFFAVSRSVPDLAVVGMKLLFGQAMMITAFSAFGFLSGVLTSRYIVIGLVYGGLIEAGAGQIPTQISRLSMTHQMRDLLAVSLGRAAETPTSPGFLSTTAIMVVFTALTLAIAAAVFAWRELTGPAEG